MIHYWLVFGEKGTPRLCRWYDPLSADERNWLLLQLKQQLLLPRIQPISGAAGEGSRANRRKAMPYEYQKTRVLVIPPSRFTRGSRSSRAVYRQHDSLFFIAGIDGEEVPLVVGELIDLFVGLLRQILGVPLSTGRPQLETQLSQHLEPGLLLLDSMVQQGYLVCTNREALLSRVKDLMKGD
ncbi:uncharacterized protein LOC34624476 [Cyclospora cayetanensis]|nr:uncharacterized protein LOC34624476 [Cyclospora cayetanensis]